jgi:tetratricopeptide (TPR) repeat protein
MIVRNEAATLPRLAPCLAGRIDRWTIVDTGSTDGTPQVARELFKHLPGEDIQDEWRGFGPSRNVALEAAEPHSDWLLTLDADETIHGDVSPEGVGDEVDAVEVEEHYGNLRFWLPRLVRSGRGWRWQRRAHEYLSLGDRHPRTARCSIGWVYHHAEGGSGADKFEREIALLRQDWAELPDDARTAFYLGRSFDDLSRYVEARDWYRKRLSLSGWDEESFYARWRLGCCLRALGSPDEACATLWRAWAERPWRAEPLVSLAEHYRSEQAWSPAWRACQLAFDFAGALPDGKMDHPSADRLFVHSDAARWQIAYEAAVAAWYVGAIDRGRDLTSYLLGLDDLPPAIRDSVEANRRFYET